MYQALFVKTGNMMKLKSKVWVLLCVLLPLSAWGQSNYRIAAGDVISVTVFQNPDLTLNVRVHESGKITFPLLGKVDVAGYALENVESKIAALLRSGGYVRDPQVSVMLENPYGSQVAVLGHVNRPGRYPLMTADLKLTDLLAMAGGITTDGDERVVVVGERDGKPMRVEIDVPELFSASSSQGNLVIEAGDTIHVDIAPVFYIYGEVQRPGTYRVGRNMTVMQALAVGGGLTQRGSDKGIKVFRQGQDLSVSKQAPELTSEIIANDVIVIDESFF